MAFEAEKQKIRKLASTVDTSFYQPKPVLAKYGWTQLQLAKTLDASTASIAGIINGTPNIAQVKLIADTIGCSFFEFFNGNVGSSAGTVTEAQCPHCGKPVYIKNTTSILPSV